VLSIIITSTPAFSQVLIASIYLSGEKGASSVSVLYSQRCEYKSALPFSVSITAILFQSQVSQYANCKAE
jgi:hypothetical protein